MLQLLTLSFALFGVAFLVTGVRALRRRPIGLRAHLGGRLFRSALGCASGVVLLGAAALCATIALGVQGYQALTHEQVAVFVDVAPTGPQSFEAAFQFPDGRLARFRLLGDEIYVDAHILKWKPIANLLGLHTAYELDRVSGRYANLRDERIRPRSVHSLAAAKPVDVFDLHRRFPPFSLLVDTEYGSATFIIADRPARYEVRVSSTGLLVRRRSEL